MTTLKKSLLMLLGLAVAYVLAALVAVYDPGVFLLRGLSNIVLMAYSLALMVYFADHIIERSIRMYLVGIAGLITFWVVLRSAKYIAFEETEIIARHIWYLYYVPALMIPLSSLAAALSVGNKDRHRSGLMMRPAVCITLVLALFILTNDSHQLVFRFQPGFACWDSEYSHGLVFYIVYGWIALLFITAICILFSKCRVYASRRLIWIPMLPALFGVTYLTMYAAGVWPRLNGLFFGQFPESVCFTIAGIWLSLVYIGLIPSNSGYGRLFAISDLSAQIADRDYRVIYRSQAAADLSMRELSSETEVALDENTRVHRKEVHGGFVYWQDDITELNRINSELVEVGERLSEEAELLRLENASKEERAQIEAKTKTYDDIASRVKPQSRRIIELCGQAEKEPEKYESHMRTVCLLAVYIKRFANLSLLAAVCPEIDTEELFLAVQESMRHINDMGIPAMVTFRGVCGIDSQKLLECYELFEQLLESSLQKLRGVQVNIQENMMKCVFEGVELPAAEGCISGIAVENDTSFVQISLREERDTL